MSSGVLQVFCPCFPCLGACWTGPRAWCTSWCSLPLIGKAADWCGDPLTMATPYGQLLKAIGAVPTQVSGHPPENIVAGLLAGRFGCRCSASGWLYRVKLRHYRISRRTAPGVGDLRRTCPTISVSLRTIPTSHRKQETGRNGAKQMGSGTCRPGKCGFQQV